MKSSAKKPARLFFIFIFAITWHTQVIAQSSGNKPNIVIIMTDDMCWNHLGINGDITNFPTPNIDRIGKEGINVRYYSTNSMCIPGRASLLSGLYGHNTGCTNNNKSLPLSIPTLTRVLHQQGYYTALAGKYHVGPPEPNADYDYWLCTPGLEYYNAACNYMGKDTIIADYITNVLTDSAISVINRVDTPFLLLLNHNAPHSPWVKAPEFNGTLSTITWPTPFNNNRYLHNYPSVLYSDKSKIVDNTTEFQKEQMNYHETLLSVEKSTGNILAALQAKGILDNTLVIFTSDNGYMIGVHGVRGKPFPYEENMRMALLMRYPKWFSPNSTFDKEFVLNVDLFATVLEAAGIPDTFGTNGYSIPSLINGINHRDEFLYEQVPIKNLTVNVRTVRTKFFQYNHYFCTDTTEELFDMVHDSLQMVNLVNFDAYKPVLQAYRVKLDSLRKALHDTLPTPAFNCKLENRIITHLPFSGNDSISIFPNPGSNQFFIYSNQSLGLGKVEIINSIGQLVGIRDIEFSTAGIRSLQLQNLPAGLYHINLLFENKTSVQKVFINQ